ncbi:MAG: SOS response-associated peptidase [Acetobacteraceae bacterium]
MCNDYGNRIPYRDYAEAFSQLKIPLIFPKPNAAPNLEPRDEIWPTETAPVIRPAPGGVELVQLPWGLAPSNPKARAVINMRSEGRSFARGRCLVPASHYYEFTGTKSPKTRWRFTRAGADWFCFSGLLGPGKDDQAFTLLTVDAGPDVAPYHNRQPVVLDRDAWATWLDGAAGLLRPSPAGSLVVVESPRGG